MSSADQENRSRPLMQNTKWKIDYLIEFTIEKIAFHVFIVEG